MTASVRSAPTLFPHQNRMSDGGREALTPKFTPVNGMSSTTTKAPSWSFRPSYTHVKDFRSPTAKNGTQAPGDVGFRPRTLTDPTASAAQSKTSDDSEMTDIRAFRPFLGHESDRDLGHGLSRSSSDITQPALHRDNSINARGQRESPEYMKATELTRHQREDIRVDSIEPRSGSTADRKVSSWSRSSPTDNAQNDDGDMNDQKREYLGPTEASLRQHDQQSRARQHEEEYSNHNDEASGGSSLRSPKSVGDESIVSLDDPSAEHMDNEQDRVRGPNGSVTNRKRQFSRRTKTGCITCRRRKKKCDEGKPHCLNCRKGPFTCDGYTQDWEVMRTSPDAQSVTAGQPASPGPTDVTMADEVLDVQAKRPRIEPSNESREQQQEQPIGSSQPPRNLSALIVPLVRAPKPPRRRKTPWKTWTLATHDSLINNSPPGYYPSQTTAPEVSRPPNRDAWSAYPNNERNVTSPETPFERQSFSANARLPSGAQYPNFADTHMQDRPGMFGTQPRTTNHVEIRPAPPTSSEGARVPGPFRIPDRTMTLNPLRLMQMTEKEKMLVGQPFRHYGDGELMTDRRRCQAALERFNNAAKPSQDISLDELGRLFRAIIAPEHLRKINHPVGKVGPRTIVEAPFNCDYGYNLWIGMEVIISAGCVMKDPCKITIGDRAVIGPNVRFYGITLPMDPKMRQGSRGPAIGGSITIEEDCFIGADVVILPHRTIGRGSVVGAGTVVSRDVPPESVVAGNPMKMIRRVREGQDPTDPDKHRADIQAQNDANLQRMMSERGYGMGGVGAGGGPGAAAGTGAGAGSTVVRTPSTGGPRNLPGHSRDVIYSPPEGIARESSNGHNGINNNNSNGGGHSSISRKVNGMTGGVGTAVGTGAERERERERGPIPPPSIEAGEGGMNGFNNPPPRRPFGHRD